MWVFALRGTTVALMLTTWTMKGTGPGSDYCCASVNLRAQADAFFNRMWLVASNHCERREPARRPSAAALRHRVRPRLLRAGGVADSASG
jgi:hypothetical protein